MILHALMHNPVMEQLRKKSLAQIGLLALRVAVGASFMYHGYPKLFGNADMVVRFFSAIHIPFPAFFVPFVGIWEFFGGLLLILGLGTRLIGLGLMVDMFVAINAAFGLANWGRYQLEMILFAACLNFLLSGAGEFSLDAWLMEMMKKEHEASVPMPAK